MSSISTTPSNITPPKDTHLNAPDAETRAYKKLEKEHGELMKVAEQMRTLILTLTDPSTPSFQDRIAHVKKEKDDYLRQLLTAKREIAELHRCNKFQGLAVANSTKIVDAMTANTTELKSRISALEKLTEDKNKALHKLQTSLDAKDQELLLEKKKVKSAADKILSLETLLKTKEDLTKTLQQDHQSLKDELVKLRLFHDASLNQNASLKKDNEDLLDGICNFSTQVEESEQEADHIEHLYHQEQQQLLNAQATIQNLSSELHYLKSNMYVLAPAFPQNR